MANVLKAEKKFAVIQLLVEGNSIRSISRITGVNQRTILRLLVQVGNQCKNMMDAKLRNLKLDHVQCDEIWTFVAKKQSRLTIEERAERHDIGDAYLWIGLDESTKLVASFAVGKRSADNARRFMVDLAGRLVWPDTTPHASDDHAFAKGQYQYVTQISTDGFPAYPEAVDLAFGGHARYGQIIKQYKNANMPYTPSEMIATERRGIQGINEDQKRTICTSHVERNNLTIRTFMRRFTRLSLGFSKKLENLAAATALHLAHYNFVRRHSSLRMTPAMAAGVVNDLWSLEKLLAEASRF